MDPYITYRYLNDGREVEAQCSSAHARIVAGLAAPLSGKSAETYVEWCEAQGEDAPDVSAWEDDGGASDEDAVVGSIEPDEAEDDAETDGSSDDNPGGASDAGSAPDPQPDHTETAAGGTADKVSRPEDPVALPPGYAKERSSPRSSYYLLTGPDGEEIPGPSNGKWQGADGAAQGAWDHYEV